MTDNELDRLRNNILSVLIILRDQTDQQLWLEKRVLASKMSHAGPISDLVEAVGSLNHLDYVEIDRDLKPGEVLLDFSNIRLTNAGQAFFDHGNRFVEAPAETTSSNASSNVILTESGDSLTTEDGDFIVSENEHREEEPVRIDSQLWTGRVGRVLAETARRNELILLLENAEKDLSLVGASNSERALARAYIVAARTLAEAPEPPEDLIWELISRASALAGVASLLVAIIALFASVGK
ncbi:MAG: hypothetical protein BVN33_05885 [Proteobacteria bacterium ST_bin13]|nr:MAG: hypothetical protein BVN33_05885 [Proteobacteria bacterium ST_bin13]